MKAGAIAVAGGAALLGGFLKGSIEEAREAQKVGALTNAVIKSTGGVANVTAKDVDRLATSISNKTGVDDEASASGQNMLLTFTNVRNEVGKGNDIFNQATVAAVDMAAAFGGDAVSNSKMLGRALNDPTRGVTALTRVGVSFTQQQKDQIKALQESGDTLGAQKVILGELSKQTAGAAESQATAGQKFSTTWANFKESIGTALLPTVDRILNALSAFVIILTNDVGPGIAALNGFLRPAISAAREFFAALLQGAGAGSRFSALFAQVATFIQTRFMPAFAGIVTAIRGFVAVALPIVRQFVAGMRARIQPLMPQIRAVFKTIGDIIIGVMGLIQAVIQRVTAIVRGIWSRWGNQIMDFTAKVFKTVLSVVSNVLKVIQGLIKVATAVMRGDWSGAWNAMKQVVSAAWKAIESLISLGLTVVKGVMKAGWALLKTIVSQAWDQVKGSVRNGIDGAVSLVRGLPGQITGALGSLGSLLYNAGAELIQGLINGITAKIGALKDKMADVANAVKGFLPGSPVKEGPLTSWNRGAAGARLMDLLASGITEDPVVAAMDHALRPVSIRSPHVDLDATGHGPRGGAGGAAITVYDRSGNPRQTAREVARQLAFAGG